MDEDDWFAGALLDVLQANPIDLNLFGSLSPGVPSSPPLSVASLLLRHFVACLLGYISRPVPNGTTMSAGGHPIFSPNGTAYDR